VEIGQGHRRRRLARSEGNQSARGTPMQET
jgi:hypothetical protein